MKLSQRILKLSRLVVALSLQPSTTRLLSRRYHAFIFDAHGVLHDNVQPIQGATELVRALVDNGHLVAIASNTARPASAWRVNQPPSKDLTIAGPQPTNATSCSGWASATRAG